MKDYMVQEKFKEILIDAIKKGNEETDLKILVLIEEIQKKIDVIMK